jgi:hypothetical protein
MHHVPSRKTKEEISCEPPHTTAATPTHIYHMAKKGGRDLDVGFLEEVENYFYFEDDIVNIISKWARIHCGTFCTKDPYRVEQPLEHHQLYQEYCDLFEELLNSFLDLNDVTISQFYTILRQEQQLAELGHRGVPVSATFGAVLLSLTDFITFCEMMYDVRNGNEVIFCPPLIDIAESKLSEKSSPQHK